MAGALGIDRTFPEFLLKEHEFTPGIVRLREGSGTRHTRIVVGAAPRSSGSMHIAVRGVERKLCLRRRNDSLAVFRRKYGLRSITAHPCRNHGSVRAARHQIPFPVCIHRSEVGVVVVRTVHISQFTAHIAGVRLGAGITAASRCGIGAEREAFAAVAPDGFMVVDRNVFDAGLLDLFPEHAVELVVVGRMGAPGASSRNGLVRRDGIGDLRQDLCEIAAYGYHKPLTYGIVRAVGLGLVHHRLRTFEVTRLARVRTIPVKHRTAIPATFEEIDFQTSLLVAISEIGNSEALNDLRLRCNAGGDFGHGSCRGIEIHDKRFAAHMLSNLQMLRLRLLHRAATEHWLEIALSRRLRDGDYRIFARRKRKCFSTCIDALNRSAQRLDVALCAWLHFNGLVERLLEHGEVIQMQLQVLLLRAVLKQEAGELRTLQAFNLLCGECIVQLMPVGPREKFEEEPLLLSVRKLEARGESCVGDAEIGVCAAPPMIALQPKVHRVEIFRKGHRSRRTQDDCRIVSASAVGKAHRIFPEQLFLGSRAADCRRFGTFNAPLGTVLKVNERLHVVLVAIGAFEFVRTVILGIRLACSKILWIGLRLFDFPKRVASLAPDAFGVLSVFRRQDCALLEIRNTVGIALSSQKCASVRKLDRVHIRIRRFETLNRRKRVFILSAVGFTAEAFKTGAPSAAKAFRHKHVVILALSDTATCPVEIEH